MRIITILKQVPDLVEELELNEQGTSLNKQLLRFVLSEYDDYALEQSLILKEKYGGSVRAFALDIGDAKEILVTALAKGADEAILLKSDFPEDIGNHIIAKIYQTILSEQQYDLILTGVQAIDDLDGSLGPILAGLLNIPYVGVVKGLRVLDDKKSIIVGKEYPGGIISEIKVSLPAVIGIQSAEKPPRYVPIAKIRQVQKSAKIIEQDVTDVVNKAVSNLSETQIKVKRMVKPESSKKAVILDGSLDEAVQRLTGLLKDKGIVR